MLNVDINYPIPENLGSGKGAPRKYPFGDMTVGHSVFVEGEGSQGKAATAARGYRKYGMKFAARIEGSGVRIWRVL